MAPAFVEFVLGLVLRTGASDAFESMFSGEALSGVTGL